MPEVGKKSNSEQKSTQCIFSLSNRISRAFRSCDESLPLLRKSGDYNDGGETFGVCHGLPGAVFF